MGRISVYLFEFEDEVIRSVKFTSKVTKVASMESNINLQIIISSRRLQTTRLIDIFDWINAKITQYEPIT